MKLFIFAWALALVTIVLAQSNPLEVSIVQAGIQEQSSPLEVSIVQAGVQLQSDPWEVSIVQAQSNPLEVSIVQVWVEAQSNLGEASIVEAQSNPWQAVWGLTAAQLQTTFDTLVPQGYRLTYLSGYTDNNDPRYAAILEKKASVAWAAHGCLNFAQFEQKLATYKSQGYRPILVNGYTINGVDYYAGIWDKTPSLAWVIVYGLTAADYQTALDTYDFRGYTLKHVSGYAKGTSARYAAIWELTNQGIGWVTVYGLTASGYASQSRIYVGQGYRLVHITGYQVNNVVYYAAIWDLSVSGQWAEQHDLTSSQLQVVANIYVNLGYTPKIFAGYGQTVRYAALWNK